MDYVYVMTEIGQEIPQVFESYDLAVAFVKRKHKEDLAAEMEYGEGNLTVSEVDVPEQKIGVPSILYVEKGHNYYVTKVPIIKHKRRRQSRRSH